MVASVHVNGFVKVEQTAAETLQPSALRLRADELLGSLQFEVVVAEDGASGIEAVRTLSTAPVEITLVIMLLSAKFDGWFAAITFSALLLYIVFTVTVTEWRTAFRRAMNEQDSKASTKAVDALINYETVKAFGAEPRTVESYDEALGRYARASVKANTSLAILNMAQGVVQSLGLGVMALLAGWEAAHGRMGPGDVTAAVLIMTSLYMPLNFLGFAYREVRQSFIDMEAMTELRDQKPEAAASSSALEGRYRCGREWGRRSSRCLPTSPSSLAIAWVTKSAPLLRVPANAANR